MSALQISDRLITQTIETLRDGGKQNCETVVLWLGEKLKVQQVYRPEQIVDVDYFHLPQASLRALMTHLRATRLKVLAQVHSHPGEAFHSKADDKWAIVRHEGALSFVLPQFGANTHVHTFLDAAAVYRLSATDKWEHAVTRESLTITKASYDGSAS